MVTPWPYERPHAETFLLDYVPGGWARDDEWTWAIRTEAGSPLLGVIGCRLPAPGPGPGPGSRPAPAGMIGYWLGAPHRGHGYMPEAVGAVVDAVLARRDLSAIGWECTVGNVASLAVARKAGFTFTGRAPGDILDRDGSTIDAWRGVLRRGDDRAPKDGWPAV